MENQKNNLSNEEFKSAVEKFSWNSAANILGNGSNQNYCPISLYFALAAAAQGTEGKTQEEFLQVLGVEDKEELAQGCKKLFRRLYFDRKTFKLKIADSLWVNKKYTLQDEFCKNVQDNLYASLFCVDFEKKEAGEAMGKWIANNTEGLLAPVIATYKEDALVILNTVYLNDMWASQFKKSNNKVDIFTKASGEEITCEYMYQSLSYYRFYQGEGYTGTRLCLKNIGSVVFILPDKGIALQELVTPETLAKMFEEQEGVRGLVKLRLPKFRFKDKIDLVPALKSLGLLEVFSDMANFSCMIDTTDKTDDYFYISKIKQETHIGIDEDGVEAAAYTKIEVLCGALPEMESIYELTLNRPFFFGIMSDTGVPLFLGVCNEPNQV